MVLSSIDKFINKHAYIALNEMRGNLFFDMEYYFRDLVLFLINTTHRGVLFIK